MKKISIAGLLVVVALAVFSTGAAFAQENQPPVNPHGPMPNGQEGPLHVYMMQALSDVLGLDAAQLEARIESGETPYSIAIAQGKTPEEIPALFASARSKALDLAVAAGAITQEQADWMKTRGFGRGGGMGTGACDGTGRIQMHGGGRWQQTTP
jgi:hypothetical protein